MSSKVSHVDDVKLAMLEEGSVRSTHHIQAVMASPVDPTIVPPVSSFSADLVASTLQKLIAEVMGTYFLVFLGCGAIVVEKMNGSITHTGICVTWGLIIMIVVYTFEHISCHFNPAVTVTYAILRGFPWMQVPLYIGAQLLGSILASGTLDLLFNTTPEMFFGSAPSGSDAQCLVMEIIISFILMFVIFSVAFDDRAYNQFAGVAIGMTVLINALVAGTISGASMNPARSIGPAIVKHIYKGLWIYVVGPIIGCIAGGIAYNFLKIMDKLPSKLKETTSIQKMSVNCLTILKGTLFDAFHKVH
ncbi:putative aquaporin NIP-type [Silene latifolia]|uniref:putative aquaporin NIP-type n=1 Tax=Silene latifolia TaxID=37657 RepID=UPI003D76ADE1